MSIGAEKTHFTSLDYWLILGAVYFILWLQATAIRIKVALWKGICWN